VSSQPGADIWRCYTKKIVTYAHTYAGTEETEAQQTLRAEAHGRDTVQMVPTTSMYSVGGRVQGSPRVAILGPGVWGNFLQYLVVMWPTDDFVLSYRPDLLLVTHHLTPTICTHTGGCENETKDYAGTQGISMNG